MKKFYIAERWTLLSAIARSMDDAKTCCGLWYDEREPRRHMTADLIIRARGFAEKHEAVHSVFTFDNNKELIDPIVESSISMTSYIECT